MKAFKPNMPMQLSVAPFPAFTRLLATVLTRVCAGLKEKCTIRYLAVFLLLPFAALPAHAQSVYGQTAANPGVVNHQIWDLLLNRYVVESPDGLNRLDYAGIKAGAYKSLSLYLKQLERVNPNTLTPNEQMAYWINLYNALTIKVVVDAYPVKSIKNIGGLLSFGPWKKKRFNANGTMLSLDDIEHGILRKQWREPRIHYAVNCASVGCPNLQNRAFTGANLESLLNKGAVSYINSQRGARIENGALTVSSIYKWFKEDFGGSDAAVIAHMKPYAGPVLQQNLANIRVIAGDSYDWSLNDLNSK